MNEPQIERTRESLRFVHFGVQPDHVVYTARVTDEEMDAFCSHLDPKAAARTLREIAVLASRKLDVTDLLTAFATKLEEGTDAD